MWHQHQRLLDAACPLTHLCGRFNIFDFVAILPFYLNLMFGVDSVLLRLVRILRIFKLSSRIEGTKTVVEALRASFRSLLIPVYMLIVITLVFGAAFWLAEQGSESVGADGETVRIFDDGSVSEVTGIVRAGWVIIVTMTTVGYGDITPSTAAGRMVCVIAMLFGVLYVRSDRRWRVARVWVCMAHAGVCVCECRFSVAGGRSYMAMPIAIVGNNFWKAYEKHMKGKDDAKADKYVAPPCVVHDRPCADLLCVSRVAASTARARRWCSYPPRSKSRSNSPWIQGASSLVPWP